MSTSLNLKKQPHFDGVLSKFTDLVFENMIYFLHNFSVQANIKEIVLSTYILC